MYRNLVDGSLARVRLHPTGPQGGRLAALLQRRMQQLPRTPGLRVPGAAVDYWAPEGKRGRVEATQHEAVAQVAPLLFNECACWVQPATRRPAASVDDLQQLVADLTDLLCRHATGLGQSEPWPGDVHIGPCMAPRDP